MTEREQSQMDPTKQVWAFGGGKGGVGKSVVCASVAVELAHRGHRVTVLDADLGGANLHTLLGLRFAEKTLDDFIAGRCADLGDVRLSTPVEGLRIISGAGAVLKGAHLDSLTRHRLMSAFFALDDDILLIDLGAGTHLSTLDFFNAAGEGLVVTGPEPTAIQNAYAFVKSVIFRRLHLGLGGGELAAEIIDRALLPRGDERLSSMESVIAALEERDSGLAAVATEILAQSRIHLVVNQARASAVRRVVKALSMVSRRYLDVEPSLLAALPPDPAVHAAVRAMTPVKIRQEDAPFCRAIESLVDTLLAQSSPVALDTSLRWLPMEATPVPLPVLAPTPPAEGDQVDEEEDEIEPSSPDAPSLDLEGTSDTLAMEAVEDAPAPAPAIGELEVGAPPVDAPPMSPPPPPEIISAFAPPPVESGPVAPPPSPQAEPNAPPEPPPAPPPVEVAPPPPPIPEVPGLPAEIVAALMRHQVKPSPPAATASAPAPVEDEAPMDEPLADPWSDDDQWTTPG